MIFKAYDIRGLYPSEVNEATFERIGAALRIYRCKNLVLARDPRLSSSSLARALVRGARGAGLRIFDIGLSPTPVAYFASLRLHCLGAVVTASHLPPQWNGLKICHSGISYSYERGLRALQRATARTSLVPHPARARARVRVTPRRFLEAYSKALLNGLNLQRPLRVVVDASNGCASQLAPALLRALGCRVHGLNCIIDGRFPSGAPEPTAQRLANLGKEVVKRRADFGAAFDGDGDRVAFVDERGEAIAGDAMTALFARDALQKRVGCIVYDVRSSRAVREVVEGHGGKAVMSKAGHSYVQQALHRHKALLAGELSGHYYFKELGFDDGIYALLRAAVLFSRAAAASDMVAELPRYYSTPELRFPCADEKKFDVVKNVAQSLSSLYPNNVITIDGVRLELKDAWGLLRASNTEPKLVARFEGRTKKALRDMAAIFAKELEQTGLKLPRI